MNRFDWISKALFDIRGVATFLLGFLLFAVLTASAPARPDPLVGSSKLTRSQSRPLADDEETKKLSEEEAIKLYKTKVFPLLKEYCFECHSSQDDTYESGLSVETRKDLIRGGDRGAAIEPGEPEESRLVEALSYEAEDLQMPPSGKLSDEQIKVVRDWIKAGAPVPKEKGK